MKPVSIAAFTEEMQVFGRKIKHLCSLYSLDFRHNNRRMKKKITIQDIAATANVSKSTVSRVLNGNTPVAESKKKAVLEAIEQLDFQPNIFARGLAGGRSMTIGIMTQNIGSAFYDRIMNGITSGFSGSEYTPIIVDGQWTSELEENAIQTLLGRQVDGLILVGGTTSSVFLKQVQQKKPLVICAREVPDLMDYCIYVDNFQGAYEVTKYLIKAGHTEIAHISGIKAHEDSIKRCDGYKQALIDNGIEPNDNLIVEGSFSGQSGLLAMESLLMRGVSFSAVFACNDEMAQGARLALHRRNIRVPEDMSLVGFDDSPGSPYMTPPLTTMRQPAVEMGQKAALEIMNILADSDYNTLENTVVGSELVIRESVLNIR